MKPTPEAVNPLQTPPSGHSALRRRARSAPTPPGLAAVMRDIHGDNAVGARAVTSTRAADLTGLLSSAPNPGDHDAVRAYIHELAAAGLALLPIVPNTKVPSDCRTADRVNADDLAAQQMAKAAGRRGWEKVQAPAGVHLASNDVDVLDGYLDVYVDRFDRRLGPGFAVNLAVAAGASRLVAVDCDTREQWAAFCSDAGLDPETQPTVRSPGQRNHDGQMVHSDGGHFWFVVPDEVELPDNAAYFTDADGGYAVMWGSRYILIPPSVRAEGPYTAAGQVLELPDWLRERITDRAPRQPRVYDRAVGPLSGERHPIDAWSRAIEWHEILPEGWTPTGRLDSCGCPTWTAPGDHASPKSATGHEPGCAHSNYNVENPPLHIWTDHPGEPFASNLDSEGLMRTTLSKLQAVTLLRFSGNTGAAMEALGLIPDPVTLPGGGNDRARASGSGHLPEEFWAADPVFEHIRRAAHWGVNSAPAVLGAILVRISAYLDPVVKLDTGIKSAMPLNMFAGLVGSAGTGKSSAYAAANDLLELGGLDPFVSNLVAPGEEPRELPVGTGQGVAEAFMGFEADPAADKPTKERKQVHHKLLLHSDEGAGLVAGIIDNKRGSDIGPTLRAGWSGAMLGQANASSDRKREVAAGSYTLGLCVNFQLEALAALSTPEQLEYGTPQRFVYFSATDPSIPYEPPTAPDPLTVSLPIEELRYCEELKAEVRREAVDRSRGYAIGSEDPMDVHRPAMRARLAALLVILRDSGRTVIEFDDVRLADMILDASREIHDTAMEWQRERHAAESERRTEARIAETLVTAVVIDNKDAAVNRLKGRIVRYVTAAGGTAKWEGRQGLRQRFKSTERQLADAALGYLVDAGTLIGEGGDTIDTIRLP